MAGCCQDVVIVAKVFQRQIDTRQDQTIEEPRRHNTNQCCNSKDVILDQTPHVWQYFGLFVQHLAVNYIFIILIYCVLCHLICTKSVIRHFPDLFRLFVIVQDFDQHVSGETKFWCLLFQIFTTEELLHQAENCFTQQYTMNR